MSIEFSTMIFFRALGFQRLTIYRPGLSLRISYLNWHFIEQDCFFARDQSEDLGRLPCNGWAFNIALIQICIALWPNYVARMTEHHSYTNCFIFDPGGADDWSKIVVVGANVGGGQGNAEDQPSRWGGWDTGAQGYCHNWKRRNCLKWGMLLFSSSQNDTRFLPRDFYISGASLMMEILNSLGRQREGSDF